MNKIRQIEQELELIRNGILLDFDAILVEFEISKDELESAISNRQIDVALKNKYGTSYYLREQISFYIYNTRKST